MKKLILFFTVITVMIYTCGCNNSKTNLKEPESNRQNVESSQSNPFESNEETEILGTLSHSPTEIKTDGNANVLPFEYDGGEFELKYEAMAEGKAKNFGFLVFVDGVAQPYKTDTNSNYKYMHFFELENDNEPVNFSFRFMPITGKNGETVPLNVVSIYNAQFMPDMKKTSGYGGYHMELPTKLELQFNCDVPNVDMSKNLHQQIISNVEERNDNITNDFMENVLSTKFQKIGSDELNKKVFSSIFFNDTKVFDNISYNRDKTFKIKYLLVGAPGIEYKTTFYINHQPISKEDIISYKTTIEKGIVHTIEFEINTNELDKLNTFYAMSVPVNSDDYPKVMTPIIKTPSILLYEEK